METHLIKVQQDFMVIGNPCNLLDQELTVIYHLQSCRQLQGLIIVL